MIKILTEDRNSDLEKNINLSNYFFTGKGRKVLFETSIGRKRKLSTYRSKKDIYNKKHKVINQKNTGFAQNFQKIKKTKQDEYVNVLDSDLENSDETDSFELQFDSDNYEEMLGPELESTNDNTEEIRNNSGENVDYREMALKKLKESDLLEEITHILDESGQLFDFMELLEHLKAKRISCTNIAFVLLLERARFESCRNTVGMRYCKLTKKFWSIVYRLCKGVGLNFFSGEKHWGQVVSKKSEKSRYEGRIGNINFAVPDEKILRNYNRQLPKVIPPGKIKISLDLLANKNDLVIMGDGKLLAKGLKTNFEGDVNLFGHETNPNLDELISQLHRNLEFIGNAASEFTELTNHDQLKLLEDLTEMVSDLIRRVKIFHKAEEKKLQSYLNRNQGNDSKYPDKAISSCKTNMYTAVTWVRKALIINLNFAQMASTLQNNLHLFKSLSAVEMKSIENLRTLYPAEYVSQHVEPNEFPHLIERYSDTWNDLVQQSLVPDFKLHTCLGLSGHNPMKKHFKEFIQEQKHENINPADDFVQAELDGMTTVATIFMPSLLPSCAVLYEEGCSFIDGRVKNRLICTTHIGYIR